MLTCDSQHRIEAAVLCVTKAGAVFKCPSSVKGSCPGGMAFLPSSM